MAPVQIGRAWVMRQWRAGAGCQAWVMVLAWTAAACSFFVLLSRTTRPAEYDALGTTHLEFGAGSSEVLAIVSEVGAC